MDNSSRRAFLKSAGLALAASAIVAPSAVDAEAAPKPSSDRDLLAMERLMLVYEEIITPRLHRPRLHLDALKKANGLAAKCVPAQYKTARHILQQIRSKSNAAVLGDLDGRLDLERLIRQFISLCRRQMAE